jgi:hypothetical protein
MLINPDTSAFYFSAPGAYAGVPDTDYHRLEACSNSLLNAVHISPRHAWYLKSMPQSPTSSMGLGTMVHTALLEPHLFDEAYAPPQQCSATKGNGTPCTNSATGLYLDSDVKEPRCGIHSRGLTAVPDVNLMSESDALVVEGLRLNARNHSQAQRLLFEKLDEGHPELSMLWNCSDTEVLCKGRIDFLAPTGDYIVDVKTTRHASATRLFERSIHDYGYYRQAAMYIEAAKEHGADVKDYYILAGETGAPYNVRMFKLLPEAIDQGAREIRTLRRRYAECLETGHWPGYPERIEPIGLPNWAYDTPK